MKDLRKLTERGVVPVIRGGKADIIVDLALALASGGITTIEITVEAPGAMDAIKKAASEIGDKILVGAGTVLDSDTARMAILAGAEFIVSPSLQPDVITVCKRYGKIVVPGAMTPTEIVSAYELGADLVKVFPAGVLGPRFIKDVRGPLGHIPIMCTGGIDVHNAADFIKAGCVAVGVGGSLVSQKAIAEGDWAAITAKARQLVEVVQQARVEG